jgi:hypothetical protein
MEPTKLRPKDVEIIFETSRANGAEYRGNELPTYKWQWPEETWMQRRLKERKANEQASN